MSGNAAPCVTSSTAAAPDAAIKSSTTAGTTLWAVEGVARAILLFLDPSSLDGMLSCLQSSPWLRGYLHDRELWLQLQHAHFGGERPSELRYLALPSRDRGWDWTSTQNACPELQDFLRSIDEKARFEASVQVLEGNIGLINDIDGTPLDAIAFPTNSHLTNHYVGAAQAVFSRAGRGLTDFVNDPAFRGRRPTGSAVVTPAFDARVQKLIHCVGPRITMPGCYALLSQTYENVMNAVLREELSCVTMASVSTGNMGVPCAEGAQVALHTIQKFLRANHWEGKLAIVCYEERVLEAFVEARRVLLDSFNVVPPLPENDDGPRWPF